MFVAVDRNGSFLSGRSHPRLVLISTTLEGNTIVFRCPDETIEPLVIDTTELADERPKKIRYVWMSNNLNAKGKGTHSLA